MDNIEETVGSKIVDPEVLSAYEWARKYNITTMNTVEESDPYGLLLR